MALIIEDRVMETSTTTGTGNFSLAGAVAGFRDFDSVMANGDTCYYLIEAVDANGVPTGDWETGLGTFNDTDTLVRTTVSRSSNSNAAVSFAAGTKRVTLAATTQYLEAVSTSFVGCRVKRTSDQTAANYTTQTAIPFEAAVIDTDGAWSAGTPGKIVVPAAWNGKYANAQASVEINNITADVFARLFIRHQNSGGTTLYAAGDVTEYTSSNYFASATLIGVPLTTGDVFEAMLFVETDNSITVVSSGVTGMAVQVIG